MSERPVRIERRLEGACKAWRSGRLKEAAAGLREVLAAQPGLLDAIYPLSRVLHEQGQTPRALNLLTDAVEGERVHRGGRIHRALIHFDCDEDTMLLEDLDALGPSNHTVPALHALLEARRGDWERAVFPRTAFWNAEIAGRLLAILERRFAETIASETDEFHHQLFYHPSIGTGNGSADDEEEPAVHDSRKPWSRRGWESALETAFTCHHLESFLELWDAHVQEKWRDTLSKEYLIYAHYACSSSSVAVRHAAEAAAGEPRSVNLHFLHGLCLERAQAHPESAHAFVRAARFDDLQIHFVLQELARELRISLNVAPD